MLCVSYVAMQPPIDDASQWAQLQRDTAQDPRYVAVPERRRRELFDAFVAQAQASAAAAAAVAPVAPAPALSFHASNGAAARQAVSSSAVQEQEVDDWGEEEEEEGEEEMSEEERAEAMYMEMLATLSPVLRPDSLWPEVRHMGLAVVLALSQGLGGAMHLLPRCRDTVRGKGSSGTRLLSP